MSSWLPWLHLRVDHDYYARPCPLQWSPRADTAAWLRQVGCPWRTEPAGWTLLHDGRLLNWPYLPDDADGKPVPPKLHFQAHAEDPLLASVTAGLPRDASSVPHLDTATATADGDEWAWPAWDDDTPAPALPWRPQTPGERRPFVTLAFTLPAEGDFAPRRYRLRLAGRATVWKYLFIGDWGDRIEVVDAARHVQFGPATPQTLADGTSAWAIRSLGPIALRERSDQRFQLLGQAPPRAASVLLRRLPVANARQFGLDPGAVSPALVSEIYVHR